MKTVDAPMLRDEADRNFVTAYYVGTLTLLVSRRRSKIAM
jgi:hypothetical protein